ncbi:hypothetical protein F5148DRAFT_500013 [Russula earlei]|uniref:Uncharacterized protein n=1 Tax=Russula earlei TaxID=71964 RepID=A0ACC0TYG1_9AGAM|nr:hypothetical protein F5148DRAFT_500013 [Russula earlei]
MDSPNTVVFHAAGGDRGSQEPFYDVESAPLPTSGAEPQTESSYTDGSGALFSMYLDRAEEEDTKAAERWKGDADGILVFTGLFSATVAAFLVGTYQSLQPNAQDTSTFYLATITQILAASNQSLTISLPPPPPSPFTFKPPKSAIWFNSLWFSSLVISLTCALLATSLQQWARRYLRVSQPRYSPHRRARLRAFFAEGIENLHLPWAVEALPTLIHVSVFLFFAGLVVFLSSINHTVFSALLWCMGLCVGLYMCVTLLPIFRPDSPYYTPLTKVAWFCATGLSWLVLRSSKTVVSYLHGRKLVSLDSWYKISVVEHRQSKRFFRGFTKDTEDIAFQLCSDIDVRGLSWTFNSLEEDHELEEFLAGIPGFLSSHEVTDPEGVLKGVIDHVPAMAYTVFLFIERTFSFGRVSEAIQERRKNVYMKALDLVTPLLPVTFYQALHFWESDHNPTAHIFGSFDFWLLAEAHSQDDDADVAISAQCMAAAIATTVQERDQRWVDIIMRQLDVSEDTLLTYVAHGDSVLLANLIHIVERLAPPHNDIDYTLSLDGLIRHTLRIARNFQISGTLPELQNRFCALWNRIALMTYDQEFTEVERRYARTILRVIRTVYISLHHGTDSQPTAFSSSTQSLDPVLWDESSYPICMAHHHSLLILDPRSCVYDKGDGVTLRSNPELVTSSPIAISPPRSEEIILESAVSQSCLSRPPA